MTTKEHITFNGLKLHLQQMLAEVDTIEELRELDAILRNRWREIQGHAASVKAADLKLRAGSRVEFTGKHGETITGTVEKVNRKTCRVKEDKTPAHPGGLPRLGLVWNVSIGLLKPTLSQAPAAADLPREDEIDLVDERGTVVKTLARALFKPTEWEHILNNAKYFSATAYAQGRAFAQDKKRLSVEGGMCLKEYSGTPMGGCGKRGILSVRVRKLGPEVCSITHKCMFCGKTDDDVVD